MANALVQIYSKAKKPVNIISGVIVKAYYTSFQINDCVIAILPEQWNVEEKIQEIPEQFLLIKPQEITHDQGIKIVQFGIIPHIITYQILTETQQFVFLNGFQQEEEKIASQLLINQGFTVISTNNYQSSKSQNFIQIEYFDFQQFLDKVLKYTNSGVHAIINNQKYSQEQFRQHLQLLNFNSIYVTTESENFQIFPSEAQLMFAKNVQLYFFNLQTYMLGQQGLILHIMEDLLQNIKLQAISQLYK